MGFFLCMTCSQSDGVVLELWAQTESGAAEVLFFYLLYQQVDTKDTDTSDGKNAKYQQLDLLVSSEQFY